MPDLANAGSVSEKGNTHYDACLDHWLDFQQTSNEAEDVSRWKELTVIMDEEPPDTEPVKAICSSVYSIAKTPKQS
jgi:hypothetical protein